MNLVHSVHSAVCCVRYVVHCVQCNMCSVITLMFAGVLITPPIISEQTSNVDGNSIKQNSRMLGTWEILDYVFLLVCPHFNLRMKISIKRSSSYGKNPL